MTHLKRELVIGFDPDFNEDRRLKLYNASDINIQVKNSIPEIHTHILKVDLKDQERLLELYSNMPGVSYAEFSQPLYLPKPILSRNLKRRPNSRLGPFVTPNDPFFGRQWGLRKVDATTAWNRARRTSTRFNIAILDTGVDITHPDLANKIRGSANFTDSQSVQDFYGHGTHVAGIAAAMTNNRVGVAGISFNSVSIWNVKVLNDQGSGLDTWVAQGIIFAANQGVSAINMSLGGGGATQVLNNAVQYAIRRGVVVVASAGNSGSSRKEYPAGFANVIAVAATTQSDARASFSNYGASWVDVAAPGVSIFSTLPTNSNSIGPRNYGYLSGTSMASPFVAGLAAMVKATFPSLNRTQVTNKVLKGATKIGGTGSLYQFGRINALNAIGRRRRRKSAKPRTTNIRTVSKLNCRRAPKRRPKLNLIRLQG